MTGQLAYRETLSRLSDILSIIMFAPEPWKMYNRMTLDVCGLVDCERGSCRA